MTEQTPTRRSGVGCFVLVLVVAALVWAVVHYGGSDSVERSGAKPSPSPVAPAYSLGSGGQADTVYLATLQSSSQDYSTYGSSDLVRLGHGVCTALDRGDGMGPTGLALAAATSLDLAAAGYLEGAAVGAYCPRYGETLS